MAKEKKAEAGETIAKIMQWAWNCGLLIRTDHKRQFTAYADQRHWFSSSHDPYPYNVDTQFRKREECWPVIVFSHPFTDRHVEVVGRDWDELWRQLEYKHKAIFADLGCPEWPKK